MPTYAMMRLGRLKNQYNSPIEAVYQSDTDGLVEWIQPAIAAVLPRLSICVCQMPHSPYSFYLDCATISHYAEDFIKKPAGI